MRHIQFADIAAPADRPLVIGLVSDTHRLLRDEACQALQGVDAILHAGDVGAPEVIETLGDIAPTFAIRGNIDVAPWASNLPDTASIQLGHARVFMLHNLAELATQPHADGYSVVISGHSHMPRIFDEGEVLYVNPGSIGPRRFKLPISMARLDISATSVKAELIELEIPR